MQKTKRTLAALIATTATSQAAVVNVAHYGLGESDNMATTELVDDIGGDNFNLTNTANRTIQTTGVTAPGSTSYLQKTGGSTGWYNTNLGLSNNWAVQLWMNTQNTAGTIQFQTDNTATGSAVWFQNDGHLEFSSGLGGTSTPTTAETAYSGNTWYRVGIVNDGGTNYYYVDGVQVASDSTNSTLDNMTLGFASTGINGGAGQYDELNVWTFSDGDSLADVEAAMDNVPEPSSTALLGLGGLTLLLRRRK